MNQYQGLVTKMYHIMLHREPDTDGLENYVSKLKNNVPLFKLIQAISSSEEFITCQLKLIKSSSPTVYELQNYINDYQHDIDSLNKQLIQTNDLFEQNCRQLESLQIENSKLKKGVANNKIGVETRIACTQTDHEEVAFIVPLRTKNKLISKISKKVNVFMCVRNNEHTLEKTFRQLDTIKEKFNLQLCYYVYENDSSDSTPYMIIDYYRNNNLKGSYQIERLSKKEWASVKNINRSADMAKYRNKMKSLCNDFEYSDYSIIVDTDVDFTPKNFFDSIKLLKQNPDIAMVTPYAYAGNTLLYYDTYALDSPVNICVLMPEVQPVHSAFGGFAVIRTHVLEQCHWDIIPNKVCSEHNYFCEMVRKYGKVVIARDIRVHWKNKFA